MCQTVFTSSDLPPSLAAYKETPSDHLAPAYIKWLEQTRWPGRCQTVIDPTSTGSKRTTWFLDGAHTSDSLTSCGEWVFGPDAMDINAPRRTAERVLIFNCTNGRSAFELLSALLEAGRKTKTHAKAVSLEDVGSWFDQVVFCTNVTYTDGHFKGGESRVTFSMAISRPAEWRISPYCIDGDSQKRSYGQSN